MTTLIETPKGKQAKKDKKDRKRIKHEFIKRKGIELVSCVGGHLLVKKNILEKEDY